MHSDYPNSISHTLHLDANHLELDKIYLEFFASLHRYAFIMVSDQILAEEMAH